MSTTKDFVSNWLFHDPRRKTVNAAWNEDYIDDTAAMIDAAQEENRSIIVQRELQLKNALAECEQLRQTCAEHYEAAAYLEKVLSYAGEHSLAESAENRMRELEELKAKVLEQRAAIEANHKWHQEYDDSGSYADSELCETNIDALKVYTTDSAMLKHIYNSLGLLRSCRSHIPQSSISGTLPNALDREIERLEKLVPHDETNATTPQE